MRACIFGLIVAFAVGCNRTDEKQRIATEQLTEEAHRSIGMPNVTKWQERKTLKRIYELADDENTVLYCYVMAQNGDLKFLFKCMGYPMPYGTQFTNPMKTGSSYAMPQAEPNGLFKPTGADATWVMAIGPDGKTHAVFVEPHLIVSPFPIAWATHGPKE